MRTILVLLGLAALVVIGLVSTGMMTLNVTPGSVPHVALEGGKAPEVNANLATVQLGTSEKTVEVPTVTTTQRTLQVPTLTIDKPANAQEVVK